MSIRELASRSRASLLFFAALTALTGACSAGGEGEGEGEDSCTCDVDADCDGDQVCAASWCDDSSCCDDGKGRSCAAPTRVGETCFYTGWQGGDFYDSIPCAEGLTCTQVLDDPDGYDNERFCVPDVTPPACNDDADCEAGFGCGTYEGDSFCMVLAKSFQVCAPEDGVTFTRPCDEGLACEPHDFPAISLCQ